MKSKIKLIFSPEMLYGIWDILTKYLPMRMFVSMQHRHKQCWLITERPTDARDNGFVLFKWLRENHPEVDVVYAINKASEDYQNVRDLGKIIEYGSYQHWYYYFAASICCDTSWGICCPNSMTFLLMRDILPPRSKRVFLQHGITKDYMPQGRQHKLKADIFVCGAYPEWEYISKSFGYKNNEVKYLGFARFDRLIDTSKSEIKKQILYMPTWRAYLRDTQHFEKTNYYNKIKEVLTSRSVNGILERNNLELVYFVHPSIRDMKKYFETFADTRIKIYNNEDCDLQKLICSSSLLITDFSSVYFDFAYQGKPVIYYHFDYEEYRAKHYQEGYFSYELDGFGPIVNDCNGLILEINNLIKNAWTVTAEYSQRTNRFFPLRDKLNCHRHFEELCKLDQIKLEIL